MLRSDLIRKLIPFQRMCIRNKTESAINIEKLEQESATTFDVIDEEAKAREEEIERKRDKSRLRKYHRNILHETLPQTEPTIAYQGTLKYARKLYGRYGESSGVDPALCWPTKQELSDKVEYERIAYPYTISEVVEKALIERKEKEARIHNRQNDIAKKMLKLDQFKQELRNKMAKKEGDALEAKERKERLVEEVRRHFGYTVDPRDDKFKEMLEKKEKEQKKAMKEARKKVKEERMIASLINKKSDEPQPTENNTKD